MRCHWFKFGLFEDKKDDGEYENKYDYAKQVLSWLISELSDEGYEFDDIVHESWGPCADLLQQPYSIYVSLDSEESDESLGAETDVEEIIWNCCVYTRTPLLNKLFGDSKLRKGEDFIGIKLFEVIIDEPKHFLMPDS